MNDKKEHTDHWGYRVQHYSESTVSKDQNIPNWAWEIEIQRAREQKVGLTHHHVGWTSFGWSQKEKNIQKNNLIIIFRTPKS